MPKHPHTTSNTPTTTEEKAAAGLDRAVDLACEKIHARAIVATEEAVTAKLAFYERLIRATAFGWIGAIGLFSFWGWTQADTFINAIRDSVIAQASPKVNANVVQKLEQMSNEMMINSISMRWRAEGEPEPLPADQSIQLLQILNSIRLNTQYNAFDKRYEEKLSFVAGHAAHYEKFNTQTDGEICQQVLAIATGVYEHYQKEPTSENQGRLGNWANALAEAGLVAAWLLPVIEDVNFPDHIRISSARAIYRASEDGFIDDGIAARASRALLAGDLRWNDVRWAVLLDPTGDKVNDQMMSVCANSVTADRCLQLSILALSKTIADQKVADRVGRWLAKAENITIECRNDTMYPVIKVGSGQVRPLVWMETQIAFGLPADPIAASALMRAVTSAGLDDCVQAGVYAPKKSLQMETPATDLTLGEPWHEWRMTQYLGDGTAILLLEDNTSKWKLPAGTRINITLGRHEPPTVNDTGWNHFQ